MKKKHFWDKFTTESHPARSRDNLLFWFFSLLYMELLFHILLFGTFDAAFLYVLGFTLVIALVISGLLGLLPEKANRIVSCVLVGIFSLLFCSQMVYYSIFGTLCTIPPQAEVSANNSVQIMDLLLSILVLLPIPGSIILAVKKRRLFRLRRNIYRLLTPAIGLILHFVIFQCLVIGGTDIYSSHYFYHHVSTSADQTAQRFGLLTTMRLDLFSGQEAEDPLPVETRPPSNVPDTEPTDSANHLKIQILGDSMSDNTWGDMRTWVNLLKDYLPEYELTIVNSAIGGNTLMPLTADDGVTRGIAYQISSGETPLAEDADLIIVWAGANDWATSPALGTLRNGDSTTFYGAVQYVIETIQQQTDAQLLFITPLQRNSDSDQLSRTELDLYGNRLNHSCATLEQFAQAIMQTCSSYDVPCLDLYHTSGITQDSIRYYAADGLHLDAKAEPIIAEMIAQAIRDPGICISRSSIPAYDLSALTDVLHNRLCEAIVVDGGNTYLNWNFDGIKTAFSNGNVTLRYKVEINGTELSVCSTGTAVPAEENDHWTFVSYFEHEGELIRVTILFKSYGLEATAVSLG